MMLFKILTVKNEINIQKKNSTSNKNSMFSERIQYLIKIFNIQ